MYQKDKNIRLEVEDHGIGISKENLPNVWDRYYKINAEHIRFTKGSGIGLAIAKEILDQNNGRIDIKSKVHEGTEVVITIPTKSK